jgi:hypothetical protein
MLVARAISLRPDIRGLRSIGRLPWEWTGTPPVGWSGHRPPAEQQGALNAEAAHRLSGGASYP